MPRFDEGVVNNKLLKGNIILMGNPTQYGEILAQNFFIEDITKANIDTLISNNNLVQGKFYRITDAVSATLSLLVQALTENSLCDYAYNTANGELVTYDISTDLAGVPFSSVYVPYTGATSNVNLGEQGISAGYVGYDLTPTNTPATQGTTYWNANEETLSLIMNGVTQQIGLDTFDNVKNSTGTTIPKGTAVRFAGTDGNTGRLLIAPMLADGTYPSEYYMGVTAEAINNGDFGKVIVFGKLRGINTSAYNNGDILYISSTVAGKFQTTPPTAPNNIIVAATVVSASNNGTLMVRATLGSNINNDEGVKITSPATGQLLQLQSNGLWENKTKAQILGGTSSQFVKGDGSLDNTNYLSTISGISAGGELSGTYPNPSLVTSAVTGKPLTGLSVSGSAVVSTDSILTGIGKLQNQINAVVGSVNFQGVWNASTNSPSLASGVGTKGYYYVVSVPGSTNLDGITDWKLGDWAIYDGTAWQKVDNTDAVVSVNGYTGIVTLAKADIGLGNVENTALSTWAGSTNITTLGTISSGVWNGTAIGDTYISSASTWNAKIGGSGTTNYIPKFTASGTIGDSIISQSGGNIRIDGGLLNNGNSLGVGTFTRYQNDGTPIFIIGSNANITGGSATSIGMFVYGNNDLEISTNSQKRLVIYGDGQIITNSATDTGEAHIFGGSARINGSTTIYDASAGVMDILTSGAALRFINTSAENYIQSGTGLTASSAPLKFTSMFGGSTWLSLFTNKLITFGATDTGEAHIFGGSARVNGNFKATGAVINFSALPTSSAGLSAGDIWNDGGTLKIV